MEKIGILIIENDEASQSALRQVLDSEGWELRIVPEVGQALAEFSSGAWSLVIVNIAMTGLTGPVFLTLKELALAPAVEEGKVRARVHVPAAGSPLPSKLSRFWKKSACPTCSSRFSFTIFSKRSVIC